MYSNLKMVMAQHGYTQRQIAEKIGIHENSIRNKISGTSPFTVEEAFKIKELFFPNYEFSFLFTKFQSNGKRAS